MARSDLNWWVRGLGANLGHLVANLRWIWGAFGWIVGFRTRCLSCLGMGATRSLLGSGWERPEPRSRRRRGSRFFEKKGNKPTTEEKRREEGAAQWPARWEIVRAH